MTDLQISKRGAMELIAHEGAVLEAYKDSVGVWTWGIGITNFSGHNVDRYRRNPQSLQRVLEIYLWALKRYEADVIKAFAPLKLNEHQLAAAVSFHYNTGGIRDASWVRHFKAGNIAAAKKAFMSWRSPKEIIPRRRAERDLFFDGKWSGKKTISIWGVRANGNVNWSDRKTVNAEKALIAAWGGDQENVAEASKEAPNKLKVVEPKEDGWAGIIASGIIAVLTALGLVSEKKE